MNTPAINLELPAEVVPPRPAFLTQSRPWPTQADIGTFRLRCPADTPRGLFGPFIGEGYCLEPVFPDGRALRWFDPTIAADDGDFVLVELHEAVLADIVAKNRHKPGFLETYGENPSRLVTKWLRHYRATHYICEAERGIPLHGPLGPNRILGVCTYVMIDGMPAYGSGPADAELVDLAEAFKTAEIVLSEASGTVGTVQIAEEGATEVLSVEDSSASISDGSEIVLVNMPAILVDYRQQVTATCNAWDPGTTPPPQPALRISRETVGGGEPTVLSQDAAFTASASPGERVTVQLEAPGDSGKSYNFRLLGIGDIGVTQEFRNITFRVEAIKR